MLPLMTSNSKAIWVDGISKTFRIPTQRVETLKERVLNPFHRAGHVELHALRGVSFEVEKGEFFGIVGRNGSGKSTVLKLLASIYRADGGRMFTSGTIAPFIELGVGFNPELTARENVILSGVMMGLSVREARRRFDGVIDFAELDEFTDLKLKNYSSGMQVRLAFSLLLESSAEILLIDEVFAVGDAAFQHKCGDALLRLRDQGRTIVFVSHDMNSVANYCRRAILLEHGELVTAGKADLVAQRYFELNLDPGGAAVERADPTGKRSAKPNPNGSSEAPGRGSPSVRFVEAWLEDEVGAPMSAIGAENQLRFRAIVEATREVRLGPVAFAVNTPVGGHIFAVFVEPEEPAGHPLGAGERVLLGADVDNLLAKGEYSLALYAAQPGARQKTVATRWDAASFEVTEGHPSGGLLMRPTAQVFRDVSLTHEEL